MSGLNDLHNATKTIENQIQGYVNQIIKLQARNKELEEALHLCNPEVSQETWDKILITLQKGE